MDNHQLDALDVSVVKKKIDNCLRLYFERFPQEARDFFTIVEQKRKTLSHYGRMPGDHAIDRALFEMPETLANVLFSNLTPEQLVWFRTKTGSRWFARTYPKFALIPKEDI
jgi:hypothetical protein